MRHPSNLCCNGLCSAIFFGARPNVLLLLLYFYPKSLWFPRVTLPCCGCIAESQPQPASWCPLESPPTVQGPRPLTWFNLSL